MWKGKYFHVAPAVRKEKQTGLQATSYGFLLSPTPTLCSYLQAESHWLGALGLGVPLIFTPEILSLVVVLCLE